MYKLSYSIVPERANFVSMATILIDYTNPGNLKTGSLFHEPSFEELQKKKTFTNEDGFPPLRARNPHNR